MLARMDRTSLDDRLQFAQSGHGPSVCHPPPGLEPHRVVWMQRACWPRRVDKAAVEVLLHLFHDALDVGVALLLELSDTPGRGSDVIEMPGTHGSRDVPAKPFDRLRFVLVGY